MRKILPVGESLTFIEKKKKLMGFCDIDAKNELIFF